MIVATTLIVGADRDQQRLILQRVGQPSEQRHRLPVLERNDHRQVTDFLKAHGCDWSDIDHFILLAVPHSKTTVRVNATFLATSAWYSNRPLTIVPVDSLDDSFDVAIIQAQGYEFDPTVLSQLT